MREIGLSVLVALALWLGLWLGARWHLGPTDALESLAPAFDDGRDVFGHQGPWR